MGGGEGALGSKESLRRLVWDRLSREGVALPPLPPHGRIPNFRGAEVAATRLASLDEWRRAQVVKVNPDSPQRSVRLRALSEGKLLVMPTPRLRQGFILLDPRDLKPGLYSKASTIRGAFTYGRLLPSVDSILRSVERIDFIVEGSVAVNRYGERLGKGEGYGEIEYAILLELGVIDRDVPIATTVHDLQVINERMPQDPYDVPVDYVATPTRLIKCSRGPRPPGILWDLLKKEKIAEIPLLREVGGNK